MISSANLSGEVSPQLVAELREKIDAAFDVIYRFEQPTSLQELQVADGRVLFAKREDLSRIHSYKWRGACFKMHNLVSSGNSGPFVAASAGNHAQGVALAAQNLKVNAIIVMPVTTPELKRESVTHLGGDFVDIQLVGDTFDEAAEAARDICELKSGTMIPPFDDPDIVAGQATTGIELLRQHPQLNKIYVPVGGGGLVSGIAFAAKEVLKHPCQIIGVEVEKQDSTRQSLRNGRAVSLNSVDRFCDGTAVREPGLLNLHLCQHYLDDLVVVDNAMVGSAIKTAWDTGRFIPEPSGAIALAAALEEPANQSEDVAVVITGSNVDFQKFPEIVRRGNTASHSRRFFRFSLPERNGALIRVLDEFMNDLNIIEFQYGKHSESRATPVVGIQASPDRLDELASRLRRKHVDFHEVSQEAVTEFRVIPFHPDLCQDPFYLVINFPDRPGALRELMRRISPLTNICYFNFVDSGETEGRAMIGFERISDTSESFVIAHLLDLGFEFRELDLRQTAV